MQCLSWFFVIDGLMDRKLVFFRSMSLNLIIASLIGQKGEIRYMSSATKLLCSFVLCLLLSACGGGGGGGGSDNGSTTSTDNSINNTVTAIRADSQQQTTETPVVIEQATDFSPVSVNVTWLVPTTRQDGTELTVSEIIGYEVLYINEDDNKVTCCNIFIADPLATEATIEIREPGSYIFAVVTVDALNGLSELSNVANLSF